MARTTLALELTNISKANKEGVQVFAKNNTWTSPPGGWLHAQNGVWNQLPQGLYLMDAANVNQIALCLGCNFAMSTTGTKGSSRYPQSGDVGDWTLTATVP